MSRVPEHRTRLLNRGEIRADGAYVLYWMVATRRLGWNHALDRAVDHAQALAKPLLILEPLDVSYRWASDRHHQAIMDGMLEHARALEGSPVGYHAYVEPEPGTAKGLLRALAERASVVVTDDSPTFFTPRLLEAAGRVAACLVEAVDSCGLLPVREPGRAFSGAYPFRRWLQRELPEHLLAPPSPDPLAGTRLSPFEGVPTAVAERWPATSVARLADPGFLAGLPINHDVAPTGWVGGQAAGRTRLRAFVSDDLRRYGRERNDPDADASSRLSPWLHHGHLSAHEVFDAVARAESWSPARLSERVDGRREGWWGMSPTAESFLDELVTWRELGYGFAVHEPAYDRWDTLPGWARATLDEHAADPRERIYSLDELASAGTSDPLWNAAQRQLVGEGTIHNYLRMLWGKRVLEWTTHPREALEYLIELNNRYALDGRDPNSYSGIFWVLGRFDRGWPERPIFGKVRSMTSASTRRKVRVAEYLERWGG